MAIKIIEDKVKAAPKRGFRDMIREDLRNLVRTCNEPKCFEFTGDYNYKYLAQYAREEARWMFTQMVKNIRKEVVSEVEKEFKTKLYFIRGVDHYFADKFIRIYQKKDGDIIHVYGEFNPNYIVSGDYKREYKEALVAKAESRKKGK